MTLRTLVSIHSVGDAGATGPALGTGSLVHPQLVLVDRPLREELAQVSASPALRVGIASVGRDEGFVEVIDVAGVHLQDGTHEDPLIALDLVRTSAAPIQEHDLLPGKGEAAPAIVHGDRDTENRFFCSLFPHSGFCPKAG